MADLFYDYGLDHWSALTNGYPHQPYFLAVTSDYVPNKTHTIEDLTNYELDAAGYSRASITVTNTWNAVSHRHEFSSTDPSFGNPVTGYIVSGIVLVACHPDAHYPAITDHSPVAFFDIGEFRTDGAEFTPVANASDIAYLAKAGPASAEMVPDYQSDWWYSTWTTYNANSQLVRIRAYQSSYTFDDTDVHLADAAGECSTGFYRAAQPTVGRVVNTTDHRVEFISSIEERFSNGEPAVGQTIGGFWLTYPSSADAMNQDLIAYWDVTNFDTDGAHVIPQLHATLGVMYVDAIDGV